MFHRTLKNHRLNDLARREGKGNHQLLLVLRWCTRNHGSHSFWIDVQSHERQRLVAGVPPLGHQPELSGDNRPLRIFPVRYRKNSFVVSADVGTAFNTSTMSL